MSSLQSSWNEEAVRAITTPDRGQQRFDSLDGIRGIAIVMVLAFHFSWVFLYVGFEQEIRSWLMYGSTGVDLFFCLSGFLITRILLQTRDDPAYFQKFYWRRALRIFPLYYAFLIVDSVLLRRFSLTPPQELTPINAQTLPFYLYLQNLMPDRGMVPGLSHLWSLAIEEQFYLVWPFIVFVIPRRRLISVCLLGAGAALVYRCWLMSTHTDYESIHRLTFARLDTLLLGAAAGVVHLDHRLREQARRMIKPAMIMYAMVAAGLVLTGEFGIERPVFISLGWTTLALFFTTVVFWAATSGQSNPILKNWGLRTLGKYSYGVYVTHLVALSIARRVIGTSSLEQRLLVIAAATAVSVGMAWVSFHFFESYFLKFKDYFAYDHAQERSKPLRWVGAKNPSASV